MGGFDCDCLIAGGGPAGASLALALAAEGLTVHVADPSTAPPSDARGLALAESSRRILAALGLWTSLAAHAAPVRTIRVVDREGFGRLRFEATESGLATLGHVVPAAVLHATLAAQLTADARIARHRGHVSTVQADAHGVDVLVTVADGMERLRTRLLVVADGGAGALGQVLGFATHRHDYGRTLVVATCEASVPARDVAWECLGRDGPTAALPLVDGRWTVVHGVRQSAAAEVASLPEGAWLARLEAVFQGRIGRLRAATPRQAWPLVGTTVEPLAGPRWVLLGAAAGRIHPNGAQGFNLTLRDVAGLAWTLGEALRRGEDPGAASVLGRHVDDRAPDRRRVARMAHGLHTAFATSMPGAGLLRGVAMTLLDCLPGAAAKLARVATGLDGRQPPMVRGGAS